MQQSMSFGGVYHGIRYQVAVDGDLKQNSCGIELRIWGTDRFLAERHKTLLQETDYGYIARYGTAVVLKSSRLAEQVRINYLRSSLQYKEEKEYFKRSCDVIYTGAGISTSVGIPDMQMLEKSLNISELDLFLTVLKQTPEQYTEHFLSFLKKIECATPSFAHKCIAKYQYNTNCIVITENFDMLHEKSGTKVIHKNLEFIASSLKGNKLIVIGLSKDHHGIIRRYRQLNPGKSVLVVNNQCNLEYAQKNDEIVTGDIDKVISSVLNRDKLNC